MISQDLTIILTLKDRHIYSKRWLDHCIHPEFYYIIADGSVEDENRKIFEQDARGNLVYVRYPIDDSFLTYQRKLLCVIEKVVTPFVFLVDNDDLIIKNGLETAVATLQESPELVAVQPSIATFSHTERKGSKRLPRDYTDQPFYKNISISENILSFLVGNSVPLFYTVSRAAVQKRVLENIVNFSVDDPFLFEFLHTLLILTEGPIGNLNSYGYARQADSIESIAQHSELGKYWRSLEPRYSYEYIKLLEHISIALHNRCLDLPVPQIFQHLMKKFLRVKSKPTVSSFNVITRKLKAYTLIQSNHQIFDFFSTYGQVPTLIQDLETSTSDLVE